MSAKLSKSWWAYPLLFLFLALLVLLPGEAAAVEQHLWPPSARFFAEPAPETATLLMTEEEFLAEWQAREQYLAALYEQFAAGLTAAQQTALSGAQEAWQAAFIAYQQCLKAQLDAPVKVFYGVAGAERKTNIYRDTVLALLEQRLFDLECWSLGRFSRLETAELAAGRQQLADAEADLVRAFGKNNYTMEERFRVPMQQAQQAWKAFAAANQAFLQLLCPEEEALWLAEAALQVRRMHELTLLHQEGSVFYHREREE